MQKLGVLLMVVCAGCATLQTVPPTVPEWKHAEDEPLPPDPGAADVNSPDGEWVLPMDEQECITKDGKLTADAPKPCPGKGGILMSEAKALRFKLYQLGYQQLRVNYVADRRVWTAQRLLYEARLKDAGEALQKAQLTWFERHAFQLGILGGALIGAAMSIGIVYGVAPALRTTNP